MSSPETEDFFTQFTQIWPGGYFEGDPLDPMARSSYGVAGYHSILYTTYLACIRPYVTAETVAIEIGPGRGAWTKAILTRHPKHVYALDVVPPETTRFWDYVGPDARVEYLTVKDFGLPGVPDGIGTYFFSFGVFCHLRPEHCRAYVSTLARKLASGANGFLMIADFDKFNALAPKVEAYHRLLPWKTAPRAPRLLDKTQPMNLANAHGLGGWYHLGLEEGCRLLVEAGCRIVERDVGVNPRDPVIHFQKP